ncbi:MAG: metallophosphoesterase family protein [Chloroflexi bacterium]|nr:metallophosphoesterase family protein [Chloroflexota bacterium]MCI0580595.1 metallophosphoesterase family protein [Chloroflexota bacterium]MCI0648883.1 metallophosphoesterase family protein [Chloroflexota bacterium]MCI0728213.1 metallophosphoesterase family protein [Chloroflexota bacterium]
MIIVSLADIHSVLKNLDALASDLAVADLVLLTGDLTMNDSARHAARIVDAVRQFNERILAVPGNWDPPAVAGYLTREGLNLDRRHVVLDGLAFAGVGGSLPSPARGVNEAPEASFQHFLEEATAGLDPQLPLVLVSHQPPKNTLNDRTWSGQHVGSVSLRAFIETRQPLVCFAGHIHEAVGIDAIGPTKIVNPGPLWEGGYAYAEINGRLESLEIRGRQ